MPDINFRRADLTKLVVNKKVELIHINFSREDLDILSTLKGSISKKSTIGVPKLIVKSKAANTRICISKGFFANKTPSLLN